MWQTEQLNRNIELKIWNTKIIIIIFITPKTSKLWNSFVKNMFYIWYSEYPCFALMTAFSPSALCCHFKWRPSLSLYVVGQGGNQGPCLCEFGVWLINSFENKIQKKSCHGHLTSPPCLRKPRNQCKVPDRKHPDWNITNQHELCMVQDRTAPQEGAKPLRTSPKYQRCIAERGACTQPKGY